MRKLLIAESSDEFRMALEDALHGKYKIRSCASGRTAASLLDTFQPDIMILDMLLPELDGISILERAIASGVCPAVLATTRYINSFILQRLTNMSVSYVMVEPCDTDAVIARVHDLNRHIAPPLSDTEKQAYAGSLLQRLGFPNNLDGFLALKVAIPLLEAEPNQRLSKELYPKVALAIGSCSDLQIEHAIRMAISAAWDKRDAAVWEDFFPGSTVSGKRPSNRRFISALAERLNQYINQRKE